MSIFETDQRLRELVQTNALVHRASYQAAYDGNDLEALIVLVQMLVQQNDVLSDALQRGLEHYIPPIHVQATPAVIEFMKTIQPNAGAALAIIAKRKADLMEWLKRYDQSPPAKRNVLALERKLAMIDVLEDIEDACRYASEAKEKP